jgi:hypothetical protein
MNDPQPDFWFPAKAYGVGWGLPVRWQGWFVLLAYIGLLLSGFAYFTAQRSTLGLLVSPVITTAALVAICYLKGERPVKWRWGKE